VKAARKPAPRSAAATHNVRVAVNPRDLLLSYQRSYADDDARFKMALWARQIGKDFSSGEEGIRDCYRSELEGSKTAWLIAAPSERQSLESLEKWKEWALAYKLAIDDFSEERENGKSEALLKSATITFPGGCRVIAVPGKPDTVRGFSANVLATEFAFFEDSDATWRALYPSISNPLRGLKKIRLISTPNGLGNKFADLWHENYQVKGARWSTHRTTIHDARRLGLPVDIDELREGLSDPEGWAQEFELEFLDSAEILLPYDLIGTCESVEATQSMPPEFWLPSRYQGPNRRYLGVDFGRKRHLTVAWTLELVGDVQQTREVLELDRMTTPRQLEFLRPRIAACDRTCFDYTGPGVGLGDLLVQEFGEWDPASHRYGKVELCTFTAELKREIMPKLRMAMEERRVRIPMSRTIREDLHSVRRAITKTGVITYQAALTEDGHADRCTALALAVRARGIGGGGPARASSVRRTPRPSRIV